MKKISILVMGISLFLCGCVERKLFVRTDPPQADFYFDNKNIGQTPLYFDFEWYWTHNVRVEKSGYEPIKTDVTIKSPSYLWIPLDFIAEALPFKIKDYHYLNYTLKKIEERQPQEAKTEPKTEPQEIENSGE